MCQTNCEEDVSAKRGTGAHVGQTLQLSETDWRGAALALVLMCRSVVYRSRLMPFHRH